MKLLRGTATVLFFAYIWGALIIFAPYYNWEYAKTHGFMQWVFFGEMISTAKALGWPYFVFPFVSSEPEQAELTEANWPQMRSKVIANVRQLCEGDFAAKAEWTKFVSMDSEKFCACFSSRMIEGISVDEAKRTLTGQRASEEARQKAQLVSLVCATSD